MKGKLFHGFGFIKACVLNLCSRAVRARKLFLGKCSILKGATSETVQVLSKAVIRCNRLMESKRVCQQEKEPCDSRVSGKERDLSLFSTLHKKSNE